jgi:lipoate-protein ligase A
LAADKYRSWEWTFGHTPDFAVIKSGCGKNRLRIDVHRGKIAGIVTLGPDNSAGQWHELGNRLAGTRYDAGAVASVLDNIRIPYSDCILDLKQLASNRCSS